jgi:hypothetical protein
MTALLLEPTTLAQWHALVNEAEQAADQRLDESLESYLVFLLMRYTTEPGLAARVMAMDYLKAMQESGQQRGYQLREVGDHCLLLSGLFPQRAERLRVRIGYFVDLGRSAYAELSSSLSHGAAQLYESLAMGFVALMDTLHAIRQLGAAQPCFNALQAYDLWQDTGSSRARSTLTGYTRGTPILIEDGDDTRH